MSFDSEDDYDVMNIFAHDLKTPLGGVRNAAQMVEHAGELNPQQQLWLNRIHKNVDKMLMLINDMLSTARIESNLPLQPVNVHIMSVIEQALEMLESPILEKQLTVNISLEPSAQAMYGDEVWLNHALLNLISNAVKYNRTGGQVDISSWVEDTVICFEVSDTGVGIPEADMSKIFDKFFRAKTVKNTEGTGLGLSIVKTVIERHGGDITVTSEMGVGTTFLVRFPISDEQRTEISDSNATNVMVMAGRHDDEDLDAVDDDSQEGPETADSDSRRDTL